MNYYRRIQRSSEGYAARVFEQLWPTSSSRRRVSEFLAAVIHRAAKGTSAWSVTLDPDSIRLNVGPVQLFSLWADHVWFCAVGESSRARPGWVHDVSARRSAVYPRSVNVPSRQYTVSPNMIGRVPKGLRIAALQYVDEAASRRSGKSAWVKSHSSGVLCFLKAYLGVNLPRPAQDELSQEAGSQAWEEIEEGAEYPEGAVVRVNMNAFERNPAARAACVARYGPRCSICGELLAERYGPIATDLIHVHHLVPLSSIGEAYRVDPIRDLRPVCPNCHAVLHRRRPPLTIAEAQVLLPRPK